MIQDLRFAVRSLARARGFALAALLTLAFGMGANVVVYTVLDALVIRPLPFGQRSNRLVTLHSTHPTQAQDWNNSLLSYPDLLDLRERSHNLEAIEGVANRNFSLTASRETERVLGASVTPGLFGLLGVEPQLGRGFREDDGAAPGNEAVALISDGLWHRLFGGDRSAIGRSLPVNGRNVTIIGVMPPRFAFPEHHEVWLPYRTSRDAGRDARGMLGLGLLRTGATVETARDEARTIATGLAATHPDTNRDWGVYVMPIRDAFVTAVTRQSLRAMLAAVTLVLLVGCANIASLMVARGVGRQRELTVRAALGAGRTRLVRLLLMEALLLSALGGYLGLLVASWGLNTLVAANPEPPPYWVAFAIDGRIMLFAFGLSAVTAMLCGVIPALRTSAVQVSSGLLQRGRSSSAAPAQNRLQGILVAGQVAICLSLLIGASLLARSTMALRASDTGFDARPLLSMRVYLAGDAYSASGARAAALERIVARFARIPGAVAASAIGSIPGDDGGEGIRLVPDRPTGTPGEEIGAQAVPITATAFATLGLEPVDGRVFSPAEAQDPESRVVMVSRQLAELFWPGATAAGRTLRIATGAGIVAYRVVGVVPDVVYEELGEQTPQSRRIVYLPYARAGWRTMAVLIRASGDPASLASAARQALREVEPAFAAYDMMTMPARQVATSWGERFVGRMFAAFAISALLLSCIGAYGLTAYSAAQRTREIGVRLAIGATRRDIVRLLVGRGARLALAGAVVGLPLAIVAARLVRDLLFRVSPWDPAVWMAMPLTLLASVLLASFLPARRASRTDPAVALRVE